MSSSSSGHLYSAVVGEEEFDLFYDVDPPVLFPQHDVVLSNDIQALKKLLESEKSANIIDNAGATPLHMSIQYDSKRIFDYLLTVEDIRLDAADFREMTPLMMAVTHKRDSYAIELIRRGADLNYQQEHGYTALHLAVYVNNARLAVELLEHGAAVNCQHFDGKTPLHIAVRNDDNDLVHILLYYGAIVTIYDDDGFLPFSRCFNHCQEYLQDILFDMTFDSDSNKLKLFIFFPLMFKSSNMFHKILEKTSELIYGECDLKCFQRDLYRMEAELVKTLFLRFPQLLEDIRNPLCNCAVFLDSDVADVDNTTELIYFFCENLPIERLIDADTRDLIQRVIHLELPEAILNELVCTFLSVGFELSTHDLNMVYITYGYGQLFKILLHMPLKNCYKPTFFFPMIIYGIELISSFCGVPELVDDDVRRRTSRFFVTHSHVVPSLRQLSRDVARKHLIKSYKIRDNVQFFTLLRWLPISNIYKSILGLEQEIYPTQK